MRLWHKFVCDHLKVWQKFKYVQHTCDRTSEVNVLPDHVNLCDLYKFCLTLMWKYATKKKVSFITYIMAVAVVEAVTRVSLPKKNSSYAKHRELRHTSLFGGFCRIKCTVSLRLFFSTVQYYFLQWIKLTY